MPQTPVTVFETIADLPDDAPVIVILKAGSQGFGERARALDTKTAGALSRACAAPGFSGKSGECLDIVAPHGLASRRVIVLGLGDPIALTPLSAARAGADLAAFLEKKGESAAVIAFDTVGSAAVPEEELAGRLALGIRLKRYRFDLRNTRPGAASEAGWVIGFVGLPKTARGAELARINAIAGGIEDAHRRRPRRGSPRSRRNSGRSPLRAPAAPTAHWPAAASRDRGFRHIRSGGDSVAYSSSRGESTYGIDPEIPSETDGTQLDT